MARNRPLSRVRVLAAAVAAALPVALLAALPPGSAAPAAPAAAADPVGDFKDDSVHVVNQPPQPATLVTTGDEASYHALTAAGTAVMELGKTGAGATSPKVLEMWADDEPYRKAGGSAGKIEEAKHAIVGDLDGDGLIKPPSAPSTASVEMTWLTDDRLVVTKSQKTGFEFGGEVMLPPSPQPPLGMMLLEAAEGSASTVNPGQILVAYPDRIDTYMLDAAGKPLKAGSQPMGPFSTLMAVYHKPVHEAFTDDEIPSPYDYVYVIRDNNGHLVLYEVRGGLAEPHHLGVVLPNDWTSVSVTYDVGPDGTDDDFFPDLHTMVSARNSEGNVVWVDGQMLSQDDWCEGTGPAAIDVEAFKGGSSWACSLVSEGTGPEGQDELVQWLSGVPDLIGKTVARYEQTVDGQPKIVAPRPQVMLPCAYLLEGEAASSRNECSGGMRAEPNRRNLGTPTLTTYVSAGDPGALGSYLVANGPPFQPTPTSSHPVSFTVRAAPGTSSGPGVSVPLPVQRNQMTLEVLDDGDPQIVQSAPVPVAFLAAPPQVSGSGQDADPPEFGTTSGSGSSTGESTETSFGVSLGFEYEDPLGAFGAGVEAEVERSVETGVETSHDIETSEEFRGLIDRDVVVYNTLRVKRYAAKVLDSTTGVGYQTQPVELDLPLDGVTSAASVGYLRGVFPEFAPDGRYGPVLEQVFDHDIGDPGSYRSWGGDGASVESYCDGALSAQGNRDLQIADPRVPPNPFVSISTEPPPMPDILTSDVHQVLAGTGNSEGATFAISDSTTQSRVESWGLEISASARVAYINASVSAGFAWSKDWTNTLSKGVGFASFVGHIPGENPFLKKEQYDWRSFLCQKTVTPPGGGLPVKGWVLNYTVDNYDGSGGLAELADLELISPKGSVEVSAPRPDLTFEQETGTVQTYDWELQAVNVNDEHSGQISFADPAESNAQRQVSNTVKSSRDLLPGQLYRWRVKATDFFGNVVDSDWEFFRTPSPATAPQAVIHVDQTTVTAGQTVSFENRTVPGTMSPVYTWDFGDGTTLVSSDAVVEHVFTQAGPVVVTLTVETGAGTTTDEVQLQVVPKLTKDQFGTDEDTVLDEPAGVLANDVGVDEAVLIGGTDHGTLDLAPDGTFTYTPDPDFCGPDAFTYAAGAVNEVATITVDCVNDAPKAVDDDYSLDEDGQQTVDLLANDSDVDGDTLTLTAGTPAHGTVTKAADGRFTYKPAADWCGTDEFGTTVSDGKGGTSTARARVSVKCDNDRPVAGDDTYRLDEDTQQTVNLLANDTDPEGDALLLTAGPARHGTLTPESNGRVTYQPDPDWCGTDEFVSTVTDGKGGIDTSVARVTVVCINDGPVGSDDSVTVDEDDTITIDPVGNDPDGDTVTVTVDDPDHGTVTEDDDGNLVYQPDPDFCGTETLTVTLTDGNGGSTSITVEVTVECANDAPLGVDDGATVREDRRLTLDPTVNDSDPDAVDPALTVLLSADPDHGDVRLLTTGRVAYVPERHFCGTDRFTYRPVDSQGVAGATAAMVTVEVRCVNDRPRAVRDQFSRRLPKSGKVKVGGHGVLRNDVDVDSKLRAKLVRTTEQGWLRLGKNGRFTFRVQNWRDAPRWVAFTYRACDEDRCSKKRRVVLDLK